METTYFTALADPTRMQIIELLRERPRSVGEIAGQLAIRQPQASKHLQVLESAGLVKMYPLAQRRIYAVQTAPLQKIKGWIETFAFEAQAAQADVLAAYQAAIQKEQRLASHNAAWADERRLKLRQTFAAPREIVWRCWTTPKYMKEWWSPEHFTVPLAQADLRPGGKIRIGMQDADGTRYISEGTIEEVMRPERFSFTLSPLGAAGEKLFEAHHTVTLISTGTGTELQLDIRLTASTAAAASYIAGIELGWRQSLAKLDNLTKSQKGGEKNM